MPSGKPYMVLILLENVFFWEEVKNKFSGFPWKANFFGISKKWKPWKICIYVFGTWISTEQEDGQPIYNLWPHPVNLL